LGGSSGGNAGSCDTVLAQARVRRAEDVEAEGPPSGAFCLMGGPLGPFLFVGPAPGRIEVMLRERLIAITEPLLVRLGYELVDVEYAATRSEATLRVYIDWPDGRMPADRAAVPDDGTRAF